MISKLSGNEKKLLIYLALFRHEINLNILKSLDHFSDIQTSVEKLKNIMLIEGEGDIFIRDFLKKMILTSPFFDFRLKSAPDKTQHVYQAVLKSRRSNRRL